MQRFQILRSRPWFFQINYLAIVGFSLILPFLHGLGHRPLAVACLALIAVAMQLNPKTSIMQTKWPIEIKFYFAWCSWSILSGLLLADYPSLVWFEGRTLIRMIVFLWAAYAIFVRQCQHQYFFLLLVGMALIQVLALVFGYRLDVEAGAIGGTIIKDEVDLTNIQAAGLTGNANSLAFALVEGVWASMLLWRNSKGLINKIKYPILIGMIIIFTYFTIQSASRKSLLVLATLIGAWLTWMIPGKLSIKSVVVAGMLAIVAIVAFSMVSDYVMTNTYAGKRFQQWFDAGGGDATEGFKSNVRYWLYIDGFKFWLSNPVAGIGLGHFRVFHWSGLYSHSDIMEPLATTGAIGFVLYHGFAISIIVRIVRLLMRPLPPVALYTLKGMLLFMICNHYLIGLGCPWFSALSHNLIIIFISAYTWRMWQELVRHRYLYAA